MEREKTARCVKALIMSEGADIAAREVLALLHPEKSALFESCWTRLLAHTNGLRELYDTPHRIGYCEIDKLELMIFSQLARRAFIDTRRPLEKGDLVWSCDISERSGV